MFPRGVKDGTTKHKRQTGGLPEGMTGIWAIDRNNDNTSDDPPPVIEKVPVGIPPFPGSDDDPPSPSDNEFPEDEEEDSYCYTTPGTITSYLTEYDSVATSYLDWTETVYTTGTAPFPANSGVAESPPFVPDAGHEVSAVPVHGVIAPSGPVAAEEEPEPTAPAYNSLLRKLVPRSFRKHRTVEVTENTIVTLEKRAKGKFITRVWTGSGMPPLDGQNSYDTDLPPSVWEHHMPITSAADGIVETGRMAPSPTQNADLPQDTACISQEVVTTTIHSATEFLYSYNTVTTTVTVQPGGYGNETMDAGTSLSSPPLPSASSDGDDDDVELEPIAPPPKPPSGGKDIEDSMIKRTYWIPAEPVERIPGLENGPPLMPDNRPGSSPEGGAGGSLQGAPSRDESQENGLGNDDPIAPDTGPEGPPKPGVDAPTETRAPAQEPDTPSPPPTIPVNRLPVRTKAPAPEQDVDDTPPSVPENRPPVRQRPAPQQPEPEVDETPQTVPENRPPVRTSPEEAPVPDADGPRKPNQEVPSKPDVEASPKPNSQAPSKPDVDTSPKPDQQAPSSPDIDAPAEPNHQSSSQPAVNPAPRPKPHPILTLKDTDGDGVEDTRDRDVDGDGIVNKADPDWTPGHQADTDQDGIVDAYDPDALNPDGIRNEDDPNWKAPDLPMPVPEGGDDERRERPSNGGGHREVKPDIGDGEPTTPDASSASSTSDLPRPTGTPNTDPSLPSPSLVLDDPRRIDQDLDGIPDLDDPDLDNDGLEDIHDPLRKISPVLDSNNNLIPDTKDPFADLNGDGVPNYLDKTYNPLNFLDSDNDGTVDALDPDFDSDGDGVLNRVDWKWKGDALVDTDGDGIPNVDDEDIDGDGIPNGEDGDVDGDGTPNEEDTDIDGDGVQNVFDTDADGDGVMNGLYGDWNGEEAKKRKKEEEDAEGGGDENEGESDEKEKERRTKMRMKEKIGEMVGR